MNKLEFNKFQLLYCKYCNRECHNSNSLIQHEYRCAKNPNKLPAILNFNTKGRSAWNRGLTKETCESIRRGSALTSIKLKNRQVSSIWKPHNVEEICKWLSYVDSLNLLIPKYETRINQGYKIIRGNCHAYTKGTHYTFEHKYVAALLVGDLPKGCIIHHIDDNKLNNDIHNILVFDSRMSHNRFHHSEYAYISYNKNTHIFSTELKYE